MKLYKHMKPDEFVHAILGTRPDKHTPTPWLYEHSALGSNIYVDKYKAAIATGHSYSYPESGPSRDERIANIDFIVRCVNAHDDLVAVLRECMSIIMQECDGDNDWRSRPTIKYYLKTVERARAALAKAES